MLLRAKLSVVLFPVLAALTLLLTACASTDDKLATMEPAKIYEDAKDDMSTGAYDKAITKLDKLEGRAAGTPLAQQAQLDKAYAQHKSGEGVAAIATLDRFIKQHPVSPALDYALYLKGLVNFNDNLGIFGSIIKQDLSERDQKAARDSFEAFKELVSRFPDSRYTPDARQRILYITNSLAKYDVHVARYYFNRGAYVAAVSRAQTALTDYRDVPAQEEALYILMRSQDALGMTLLRDDAKRVLERTYPNSIYLTQGSKPQQTPWWKLW
jgi:outer membrane protein assembly factor BamD